MLTRWIVFAGLEPELFAAGLPGEPRPQTSSAPVMVSASKAEAMLRRRFCR